MAFRLEIQQDNQLRKLNFIAELRPHSTQLHREQIKIHRSWYGSKVDRTSMRRTPSLKARMAMGFGFLENQTLAEQQRQRGGFAISPLHSRLKMACNL